MVFEWGKVNRARMEDKSKKKEDREVISNMKTYHMEWWEARDKKITGLVIDRDGDKHWYLYGILHREDGPACEYENGDKCWFLKGKRHREDGPAIEWADGSKAWYLNGNKLTEREWKIRMRKKKIGKLLEC